MTNTNDDLGARIEQMIAEHIAVTRKPAQAAMERAFAKAGDQRQLFLPVDDNYLSC